MNAAALHLALNTFPPILNVAAIVVFVLAFVWKSHAVTRAALVLAVLAALIGIPVFLSGEEAEHVVEELEGVNTIAIEAHEDAAKWAVWVLVAQGVLALAALIRFRAREVASWAFAAVLILTLIATAAVFRTAYLGGKIRHPETQMAR
jgi:hypothetical protein